MAISDNYVPIRELGNGVTTVYTGTWNPITTSALVVELEAVSDGAKTVQTLGVDYNATITTSGFQVTFINGAPSSSFYVVIGRAVTQDQSVPYRTSKGFDGRVQEDSYDKLTAICQDLQEQLDRSVKFTLGSSSTATLPEPVADNLIGWNSAGTNLENKTISVFPTTIDIVTSGLADGDLLQYNLSSDIWENKTVGEVLPITTEGDLIIGGTSGAAIRLAKGTQNQILVAGSARPEYGKSQNDIVRRNDWINGALRFWQRGTSFTSIANGTYFADRLRWIQSGAMVVDVTRDTDVPHNGVPYSLKVDVTTADASVGASDYAGFRTAFIGDLMGKYKYGTSDGETLTLKFWVKSTMTGTFCIGNHNNSDRSYATEFTIDAANTWEEKTISIPADQAGTWVDSGSALGGVFVVTLMAGTDVQITADTWTAGGIDFATSGIDNGMDDTANEFFFADFRLVIGDSSTAIEHPSYSDDLDACQFYYQKTYDIEDAPATVTTNGRYDLGAALNNSIFYGSVLHEYQKRMRDAPTITTYSTATGTSGKLRNRSSAADVDSNPTGATDVSALITGNGGVLTTNNSFEYHATFDAEI